jgi:hypothetical protein
MAPAIIKNYDLEETKNEIGASFQNGIKLYRCKLLSKPGRDIFFCACKMDGKPITANQVNVFGGLKNVLMTIEFLSDAAQVDAAVWYLKVNHVLADNE